VYLNVYHLFKPSTNKHMMRLGFGGAFHSALEFKGTEYAFGGHYDEQQGIYEMKPGLWEQREREMRKIDELALKTKRERKAEEARRLVALPPLKERRVIGTWIGSDREWESITQQLHTEGEWRGPSYRLLSQNCNHFVADMFDLLCHNRFFTLAPGVSKTSLDYLYTLTIRTPKILCCCPFIPAALNAPLPPPPYSGDVFQGVPRRLQETPRFPAGTIKLHPRWLTSGGLDMLQSPVPNNNAGTAFPSALRTRMPSPSPASSPAQPATSPLPQRRAEMFPASPAAHSTQRRDTAGGAKSVQFGTSPARSPLRCGSGASSPGSAQSGPLPAHSPLRHDGASSPGSLQSGAGPSRLPMQRHRSAPSPLSQEDWVQDGIMKSAPVADIDQQKHRPVDGDDDSDGSDMDSPLLDFSISHEQVSQEDVSPTIAEIELNGM